MTCRDCIHYFVCSSSGGEIYSNEQKLRDDCSSFMRADNTEEVVRCKECKFWTGKDYDGCCIKNGLSTRFSKDYCSYGERREENEG